MNAEFFLGRDPVLSGSRKSDRSYALTGSVTGDRMFRGDFQEERQATKDSKLQAVFSKLTGVLPRAEDLGNGNPKTMSSDIIESVLADTPVPVPTSKYLFSRSPFIPFVQLDLYFSNGCPLIFYFSCKNDPIILD